ncbi:MAG: hypothetical protein ACJAZP_002878 [Psychromonas sp.]|jgi:hypothetical protein|uniref:hypothetical protein n=1 Tax=Psychromonas sp. TaxID=1884585 RepID=UPI0039E334EF
MLKQLLRRIIIIIKPLSIFIFGVVSLFAGITSPAFAASSQWDISWVDNSANEEGFIIERKIDGEYLLLATLAANTTTYTEVDGIAGQANCYRVGAFNQAGSAYSEEACIDAAADLPTTQVPTTQVPTTEVPTTEVPTAEVPTAEVPTAEVPTTEVPTTEVPTTEVPTTQVPTTQVPTTEVPTTQVPTTEVPTTQVPTTQVSTTEVPTTQSPTTEVPTATIVVQSRVSASKDDAEEDPDGSMSLRSSDLELVEESFTQTVGIRFTGLEIPENAIITKAYIQFKVDETKNSGDALFDIVGESTANASSFDSTNFNISYRTQTSESISWSPALWSSVGATGADQRSSDLTSIVQEIVSTTGWNSGNAMVFIFSGSGKRVAESFDGDQSGAPLLYIEYTY